MQAAQQRYDTARGSGPERLVSGSDDFTMFLWEPSTSKKPLHRMTGHVQLINQASPSSCTLMAAWHVSYPKIFTCSLVARSCCTACPAMSSSSIRQVPRLAPSWQLGMCHIQIFTCPVVARNHYIAWRAMFSSSIRQVIVLHSRCRLACITSNFFYMFTGGYTEDNGCILALYALLVHRALLIGLCHSCMHGADIEAGRQELLCRSPVL